MINRYPGPCSSCGVTVAPNDGTATKIGSRWTVRHADCASVAACDAETVARAPRRERYGSSYARFSSGAEVYQNRRGRCEDAPCCGCCS